MHEVSITRAAEEDLESAVRYIAVQLGNAPAAARLLDGFDELVARLSEVPGFCPLVRDDLAAAAGYRWTALGNYMAFYTVDEGARRVTIERILYKRRDWSGLI